MHFKLLALASIFAVATAQDTIASEVAKLPACAISCLTTAATDAGCSITDYACQCGDKKNAITKEATPCVVKGCSTSDALSVQGITAQICVLAGAQGGSGSSSAAAPTSAAASSASSAASSVGSSESSAGASGSSKASSVATSATGGGGSATSSAGGGAATGGAGSTTSSAGGAATSSVVPASANKMAVGGLMAGAAALVAIAM